MTSVGVVPAPLTAGEVAGLATVAWSSSRRSTCFLAWGLVAPTALAWVLLGQLSASAWRAPIAGLVAASLVTPALHEFGHVAAARAVGFTYEAARSAASRADVGSAVAVHHARAGWRLKAVSLAGALVGSLGAGAGWLVWLWADAQGFATEPIHVAAVGSRPSGPVAALVLLPALAQLACLAPASADGRALWRGR